VTGRMRSLAVVAAGVIAAASCTGGDGRPTPPPGGGSDASLASACSLPPQHLLRIRRGYHPERSGEIQIVPRLPHVMAEWLAHAGPWEHVQRVPLLLYGPGHVPAVGAVERPVTLADVAPTLGKIVGSDFRALDGRPLREALPPEPEAPPRLVLLIVWDSAGRNVLDEHPDAWPTLRRLIPEGVWYEAATVGTSPSTTPAVHTTLGTGAYPRRHGLVDLRFRLGDALAWIGDERPGYVLVPTLADRHAAETGQVAEIGLVASLGTLGLIGHGASTDDGGRHLVAMQEDGRWTIGDTYREHFRFPAYVNDVHDLADAVRRLDLEDGALDGAWLGEQVLDDLEDVGFSPALAEHQTAVLEAIIRREGFGADAVPDLLATNYKQIDAVGHRWTMNSPQMAAVVRRPDDALAALIGILDREVGAGEWVIAVTADHGSIPDPRLTGAAVVRIEELTKDLRAAFDPEGADRSVVEQTRPTQIWIDESLLREAGFELDDVAAFLRDYRRSDNDPDPGRLSPQQRDERLFAAAFPSEVMEGGCPSRR
jgi:hypothetical protein